MREDWIEVELGRFCDFIGGGTPSKKNQSYWGGDIPWTSIKDLKGKFLYSSTDTISEDGLTNSASNIAEINDIILATRINPGRPIIAKIKTAINQDLKIVKPKISINSQYLYYAFLNAEKKIVKASSGTTVLGIRLDNLKGVSIPLPPLPEQRAIVSKIELLFAELDHGITSLKKAQEQLKVYRQAVLKEAFEGKITQSWREKQSNLPSAEELLEQIKTERQKHYEQQVADWEKAVKEWEAAGNEGRKPKRVSKPKAITEKNTIITTNESKIPQGWLWSNFCNVTYKIGDIDHKMPKVSQNGLPYLSTGNLKKDGTIDFTNSKTISRKDFEELSRKIKPQKGDILFPRYGTIGRNILIDFDKEFLVSYSCAIVKNITKLMNERFVYYYSISPLAHKEIKRYTVETTQANIGIASIEKFLFPLCSKYEQTQIVEAIESRLSICDRLEKDIEQSLKKAEALRQSILKQAFEGELLSEEELKTCRQAADWEPAEELLKRIQMEKTPSTKKNKTKAKAKP